MSSSKRPRSPSASSVDPSTSKVPRTTTLHPGHSLKEQDHMLVNDPTSPPSYISVGQTRLKVHDGANNEPRSRICRGISRLSEWQIRRLILGLAGYIPNPEQTINHEISRVGYGSCGFPAIEVCTKIYESTDSDDTWQSDHAHADTPKHCYRKIERIVDRVVDEVLELMLNEMTNYQVAFNIWLEAATQLIRLARRIDWHGRVPEATKFGRDVADLGARGMVMDKLSSVLPALMVFEYSTERDEKLDVVRKNICPTDPHQPTTSSLSPELTTYPNVLADFDAIRAQWKARGVEIEQERADADRQDLTRDQGQQEHEYASEDGEDDGDDYLFDELDVAKAADEINRAISAHLRK